MWHVITVSAESQRTEIEVVEAESGKPFRAGTFAGNVAQWREERRYLVELFEAQNRSSGDERDADTAFDAIETWAERAAQSAAEHDWAGVPPLRAIENGEAIARYLPGDSSDARPQCVAWHDTAGVLIALDGSEASIEITYTPERESERRKQRIWHRHATPDHRLETILEWRAYVGSHSAIVDGWTLMRESGRGWAASITGTAGFVVATVLRRLTRPEPTLDADPRAGTRRIELEDHYPALAKICPSLHDIDCVEHASAIVFVHGTASCGIVGLKDLFGLCVNGQVPSGPVYRFEHDTFLPVVDNSRELADLVAERVQAGRLLLVAHSRGGLVAADAAHQLKARGYAGHVGVHSFGTPFKGTPLVAMGKKALNLLMKLGEELATNVPLPLMSPLAKALFYVMESPTLPRGIMAMHEDSEALPFIERSAAAVPLTCWGSNFDVQSGAAGYGTMGDAVLLGALQGQPHDMVVPLHSAQACGTPAQSGVLTCAHGHYFRERAVQQVMAEWLQPPRPIRVSPRLTLKAGAATVPPPARAAGIVAPDTASFRKKPP